MFIFEFIEYTLSGWLFVVYFIFMLICSLACLGVVGDRVSKKQQADLIEKREKEAQEEYKKAQSTIEKQANSYSVDTTLDPSLKKENTDNLTLQVDSNPSVDNSSLELVVDSNPQNSDVVATSTENNNGINELIIDAPVVSTENNTSNELVIDIPVPAVDNNSSVELVIDSPTAVVDNAAVVDNTVQENTNNSVPSVLVIDDNSTNSSV